MKTKRNELPDMCYTALRTTNELVGIKKNENGYFPYKDFDGGYEEAKKLAELYNKKLELSPAQIEAMVCGSMFGWDSAAANPQTYFDKAVLLDTIHIDGHLNHPCLSIGFPINGNLYRYKIAGIDVDYIDLQTLTSISDHYLMEYVGCLNLDLVAGKPLIPVKSKKSPNGSYTLKLEDGVTSPAETNAAYSICCRIDVGEVQFVLAYHRSDNAPTPYANWERTPGNEPAGSAPSYYWGHYCESCASGVANFIERVTEKYEWQNKNGFR